MAAFKVYNNAQGKMAGVSHISIAAGQSPVCNACGLRNICYAKKNQAMYPVIKKSYSENGEKLTERVYDTKDIPFVNSLLCRFNAFGEVFTGKKGSIQLSNYVKTCEKNPAVRFALWSRNYKTVEAFFKKNQRPTNLRLIRSTESMDSPLYEVPAGWDGVFNVVTKEFAKEHAIPVNCGVKDESGEKIGCARCSVGCYAPGAVPVVFEIKK
jgi:hypothetical protein